MICDPEKPGGYTGCNLKSFYKSANNFYLLNHPNLRWVATNSTNAMNVPNKVEILSGGAVSSLFPRFTINGVMSLGKVSNNTMSNYYS
jgi:hypothetical protein